MERTSVQSRAIVSVGYDATEQALEIEYRNGGVYRYLGVPASVHEWLMRTPEKGAFVARKIANAYAFETVGAPEPTDAALEQALRDSLTRNGERLDDE